MPIHRKLNQNFFNAWSPEMAYVLGFFAADGSITENKRGSHYIEFEIIDKDLLENIRKVLGSNHKITERNRRSQQSSCYRLQMGSRVMCSDLRRLGMMPAKSKTIRLPNIPEKYLPHFVRGYFDGDGNVIFDSFKRYDRNTRKQVLLTRFTSGSKMFLKDLQKRLVKSVGIKGFVNFWSGGWRLNYGARESLKLADFMYAKDGLIYLNRKHRIYLDARRYYAAVA